MVIWLPLVIGSIVTGYIVFAISVIRSTNSASIPSCLEVRLHKARVQLQLTQTRFALRLDAANLRRELALELKNIEGRAR